MLVISLSDEDFNNVLLFAEERERELERKRKAEHQPGENDGSERGPKTRRG